MTEFTIQVFPPGATSAEDTVEGLTLSGDDFVQSLHARVRLGDYAQKLSRAAFALIALEAGRRVGYAAMYIDGRNQRAFISHLGVSPAFWGNGCAACMIDKLVDLAREHGCKVIDLEVQSANGRAVRFWQRQAFLLVASEEQPGVLLGSRVLGRAGTRDEQASSPAQNNGLRPSAERS